MPRKKIIKAVFGKAKRSGFRNVVAPVRHVNRAPEDRFDALGGGIVVGLSTGVVVLIRIFLAG